MGDYAASYCERCGTRYTFGSGPSASGSLGGARVLAKGLKYFVTSNSGSLGDAMAYARMDVQSTESMRVTQQFHKTFNFCMTCRQYACDKCWNATQGACLTCAPETGLEPVEPTDVLLVRTPVSRLESLRSAQAESSAPGAPTSRRPEMPAWPVQDALIAEPVAIEADGAAAVAAALVVAEEAESERLAKRSLWPIQDDLDGEKLDLTPEELALVEGQLEHLTPHAVEVPVEQVESGETFAVLPEADRESPQASPESDALVLESASPAAPDVALTAEVPTTADAADQRPIEPGLEHEDGLWPIGTPWLVRPIRSGTHVLGFVSAELVPDSADKESLAVEPTSDLEVSGDTETLAVEPEFAAEPEVLAEAVDAVMEPTRPAEPEVLAEVSSPALEPELAVESEPAAEPIVFVAEPEWAARADILTEPESPLGPAVAAAPEPEAFEAEPEVVADAAAAAAAEPEQVALSQDDDPSRWQWEMNWPFPSPVVDVPDSAASVEQASEQIEVRAADAPLSAPEVAASITVEPILAPEAIEPLAPPAVQQPLFEVPAASVDRWAASARPLESDAHRAIDELPAAWQPLGASWPAPTVPDIQWRGPEPTGVPAAIVAAQQTAKPAGPAIWAASAQEVMSRGNVRACHHCALPVSTHARFCRRCGTEQV